MTTWQWVGLEVILAIHDRQMAEHGGLSGVLNAGALEGAMARSQQLVAYSHADAATLAAAYAWGLAHSHGFADGNKRTAWVNARLFLADSGFRLHFEKADAVRTMLAVASGELTEEELARWFRERLKGR